MHNMLEYALGNVYGGVTGLNPNIHIIWTSNYINLRYYVCYEESSILKSLYDFSKFLNLFGKVIFLKNSQENIH